MPEQLTTFLSDYQKYTDLLVENGIGFVVQIVLALLVFVIGRRIARWVTNLAIKALQKNGGDQELIGFMDSLIYYALLAMVIITALGQLGIKTASFIAVIGAAGLAVGLALQGSLSNFAAGVLILILRPFEVDDFVEISDQSGVVRRIRIFTTDLRTPDNKYVIIPNSRVLNANIVNYTASGQRRVDMVFGVDYSDDIDQVREILERLLAADDRVLKEKAPVIAVNELADSSVNFVVRPWVNTSDYWPFYWEMTEKVKKEFDAQGVTIPFPQRVVHKPE